MGWRMRWPSGPRAELGARLASFARETPGTWSFAVAEGGMVAAADPELVHSAASTIKVPLLLAVLDEVARDECELSETIPIPAERTPGSGVLCRLPSIATLRLDELLELMITVSDNTATNVLIDRFGLDRIGRRFRELGLVHTRLRRHMFDDAAREAGRENVATAGELALLLDRLCTTRLLPAHARGVATQVLGGQQLNDRMPSHLTAETGCLHKTGELAGIRHDVGILCFDEREVAFAAMAGELPGVGVGTGSGPAADVIGRAGRTVVDLAKTAEAVSA